MFLERTQARLPRSPLPTRLPTVFGFRENVDDGGLMSYGTDLRDELAPHGDVTWTRF